MRWLLFVVFSVMVACSHTPVEPKTFKKPTTVNETLPNGTQYQGEIKFQVPHGKGKMVWRDGLKYEGDFYLSLPHGKGTYRWLNGRSYHGLVKQGFPHGMGKVTTVDGETKIGHFLHGLEQGVFRVFQSNGKLVFRRYDRGVLQKEWEEDFISRRKRLSKDN